MLLPVGSPKPDQSRGKGQDEERCLEENSDTISSDASSTNNSSNMKHRANDTQNYSWLYNNRQDQGGWKRCYTVMLIAHWKCTTLSLFLDSVFPKIETNAKIFLWRQNFGCGSTRPHSVDSEGAMNLSKDKTTTWTNIYQFYPPTLFGVFCRSWTLIFTLSVTEIWPMFLIWPYSPRRWCRCKTPTTHTVSTKVLTTGHIISKQLVSVQLMWKFSVMERTGSSWKPSH